MSDYIQKEKALKIHVSLIFLLVFLSLIGVLNQLYFHIAEINPLYNWFNLDRERNIPSVFSALALLLAAFLLMRISIFTARRGETIWFWVILACIFVFLSIDEHYGLHERLIVPMRTMFNATGIFYFTWIVPYGILLILYVVGSGRSLLKLPSRSLRLIIISGVIFVSGAIGFEMLGGARIASHGPDIIYAFIYTVEETLEMLGVALFIYALLDYTHNTLSAA